MRLADYWRTTPSRIAVICALLFAISSSALLAVIFSSTTGEITEVLHESIEQDVRSALDAYREHGTDGLIDEISMLSRNTQAHRALYMLQDANGRVIAGNLTAVNAGEGWQDTSVSRPVPKSPGGALLFGTKIGDLLLIVGRRTQVVSKVQKILVASSALALTATSLLALLYGITTGGRRLRRIEALGGAARQIINGDLSRRVPVSDSSDEIDNLAHGINQMLEQIEALTDDLKQVTNDIAHDLRTPISRLRQRLDSALQKETTLAGFGSTLDSAISDIDGILSTFNSLLHIAQLEAGGTRSRFRTVSLSEIGRAISEAYASVAEDNGQIFHSAIADGIAVWGDHDLLTQLVANLVENAIRHTPAGTRIELAVRSDDECPVIAVADSGPGIPADEREKVFQRFYRLDRSRSTAGTGLGLSLVRVIAMLHRAELAVRDNQPGLYIEARFAQCDL